MTNKSYTPPTTPQAIMERAKRMDDRAKNAHKGILTASEWKEQQQDELLIQKRLVQRYVAETKDRIKRKALTQFYQKEEGE